MCRCFPYDLTPDLPTCNLSRGYRVNVKYYVLQVYTR